MTVHRLPTSSGQQLNGHERPAPVLPEPAAGTTVSVVGRLRGAVFGIDAEKVLTRFENRGWRVDDDRTRDQLYSVWRSVAYGYNAAVREPQLARLTTRIEGVDPAFRGWAWEGAGMGLTLLDRLMPPPRRATAALRGPAMRYHGAFNIRVGWTLAMVRQVPRRPPARLDPLYGWMVYDGVGFHAGPFKTKRVVEAQREPRRLTGPRALIFDHGLGRSFWWMCGADPDRIRETIEAFPRHGSASSGPASRSEPRTPEGCRSTSSSPYVMWPPSIDHIWPQAPPSPRRPASWVVMRPRIPSSRMRSSASSRPPRRPARLIRLAPNSPFGPVSATTSSGASGSASRSPRSVTQLVPPLRSETIGIGRYHADLSATKRRHPDSTIELYHRNR